MANTNISITTTFQTAIFLPCAAFLPVLPLFFEKLLYFKLYASFPVSVKISFIINQDFLIDKPIKSI